MWWAKLSLLIAITVGLTWLIVWCASWIKKNRERYPGIYKKRGLIGAVVYVILHAGEF